MADYRCTYTGPLELYDFGRYAYHVLYAPPELQAELLAQQRPRVRISGELEGVPVNLAWQPSGDGRLYLLVSDKLRRARDLLSGDPVTVRFNIADPIRSMSPRSSLSALRMTRSTRIYGVRPRPGESGPSPI